MKKILFLFAVLANPFIIKAQFGEEPADTSWKSIYRATPPKINDLVHTKLDVKFDYAKSYLYGKEWVTLQPHFYPTDTLTLDAKGMDIHEVSIMKGTAKTKLKYEYDGWFLKIWLDKKYNAGEKYTVYIDYTSKPDELKIEGSVAITRAKGLYFINPKGEEADKPTQIWTQGETESNSVWFPTIDKPNQKTTEEIYMTVPAKYVTLSNGSLISQKKNTDGTRTDYWKMDLPHSPYLFFMGVGDFAIIKDTYNGKEISYYVEKEYATVAKKIFGETPAMIANYERVLGVPFAWPKYAQIVGRDYVSGAMENTSATLHQEAAYQNARQLTDRNIWEDVVAHELFHQWFGDLVTPESWSNITLSESFAEYGETIWQEYRYGKDAADEHINSNRLKYLEDPSNAEKNLVRYFYNDKEDVFDNVSYPKGAAIIHMLRGYVGDAAFYKALNNYLTDYRFKNAEPANLRLAFEEVTGQDLQWFFNQWYYGNGHPKLKIDYAYTSGKAQVIIEQTQRTGRVFRLPMAIDVYNDANKTRYNVWVEHKIDTFTFIASSRPTQINVDAEKVLLAEKTDNKTSENFIEQWKYAANYLDRKEALDYFAKKKMPEITQGLKDKFYQLRMYTLDKINAAKISSPELITIIEKLADKDASRQVQAKAIEYLVKLNDPKYKPLFSKYVTDSSYSVAGASLSGLMKLDPASGYVLAKKYSNDAKGKLGQVIMATMMSNGVAEDFAVVYEIYKSSPPKQTKIQLSVEFANYLVKVKNEADVRKGINEIMNFRNMLPQQFLGFIDPSFKIAFDKIAKARRTEGNAVLADYISGLIK